eukprot:scaffold25190_cov137-Cylindrotheca_fusiformis.AAC.3
MNDLSRSEEDSVGSSKGDGPKYDDSEGVRNEPVVVQPPSSGDDTKEQPEKHNRRMDTRNRKTGSFRFYSDADIQEPPTDQDNILRGKPSDDDDDEKEEEEEAGHDISMEESKQEVSMEQSSDSSDYHSADDVLAPNPDTRSRSPRGILKGQRVSSRLLLAQEIEFVPVSHSRGSEITTYLASYESLKLHLNSMVKAATDHLSSMLELEKARSELFFDFADFADQTPLKEVIGLQSDFNKEGFSGESPEAATRKYRQEILRHAVEWRDTVTSQVDGKLSEYRRLEREYFHYNSKTARLRRRVHGTESWNMVSALNNRLAEKLARNEKKMQESVTKHREMANEVCFLLEQVTNHGWKDLYPLVASTMEWETDRVIMEDETIGTGLPATLDKLADQVDNLQVEAASTPRSFLGTSDNVEDANAVQIDPAKPTLFLDDACPFAARVWITLLEKEPDPLHPKGFHVIPVCATNSEDPGLMLLKSLGMDMSPVLVHNGNVFSDSIRVAEYVDRAVHHPLYQSIPALIPKNPTDLFNMKAFLQRHSKISEVFYSLMDSEDESARPHLAKELFDILGLIDEDLRKFAGPYFCGNQFTLADVSIFPFVEHIQIILSTFGGIKIPESLTALLEWFDIVSLRPSVQLVTADRTEESLQRNSYLTSMKRGEYLIEYHQHRVEFSESRICHA